MVEPVNEIPEPYRCQPDDGHRGIKDEGVVISLTQVKIQLSGRGGAVLSNDGTVISGGSMMVQRCSSQCSNGTVVCTCTMGTAQPTPKIVSTSTLTKTK